MHFRNQPTVEQVWEANRPPSRADWQDGGPGAARQPARGNFGSYTLPPFGNAEEQLSDVPPSTWNATGGFNLYQFLMYLSQISGISIIIDPYWFDDPTGNRPYPRAARPGARR